MTNLLLLTNIILTAYCPCQKCCGKWADGVTASGRPAVAGRTVAHNLLPFGTVVIIPTLGVRVVEDRMSPRVGTNRLDIFFKRHEEALRFGRKTDFIHLVKNPVHQMNNTNLCRQVSAPYSGGTGGTNKERHKDKQTHEDRVIQTPRSKRQPHRPRLD